MLKSLDKRGSSFMGLGNLVSVLREISFDEVRAEAETMPRLLVLAQTTADARELGLRLAGASGELAITARELTAPPADLDRFDAIVVSDPAETGIAALLRDRQVHTTGASVVHSYADFGSSPDAAIDTLRPAIVRAVPDRAPAFGRAFPPFRPAAARLVINETAMANAQFALISNIPSVVPIVGGLASASADLIVLTKNQLMMIYKLGAIYSRDLHDQFAIVQELVPVVGVGFLWRSLARGATSFLPFAAGTIPKVGIAYAGTMATGLAAEYYYRTNLRPTREQWRGFQQQAMAIFRRVPLPLLRRRDARSEAIIEATGSVASDPANQSTVRQLPPTEHQPATQSGEPPASAT